jgi:hypothetical protein
MTLRATLLCLAPSDKRARHWREIFRDWRITWSNWHTHLQKEDSAEYDHFILPNFLILIRMLARFLAIYKYSILNREFSIQHSENDVNRRRVSQSPRFNPIWSSQFCMRRASAVQSQISASCRIIDLLGACTPRRLSWLSPEANYIGGPPRDSSGPTHSTIRADYGFRGVWSWYRASHQGL